MSIKMRRMSVVSAVALMASLAACGSSGSHRIDAAPVISTASTAYDPALQCLDGRITQAANFGVGVIADLSGREQVTDGGTGRFVTQGAGDMVQSGLALAGVRVVNRRDPRILDTEVNWGVVGRETIQASTFYITGSITSFDFISGGGAYVQIGGAGPRVSVNRVLIGVDLALTDTRTGRVVSTAALETELLANEAGFGVGRFLNDTLLVMDIGGNQRQPSGPALRHVMYYGVYSMLTDLMSEENRRDCDIIFEQIQNPETVDADAEDADVELVSAEVIAAEVHRAAIYPTTSVEQSGL